MSIADEHPAHLAKELPSTNSAYGTAGEHEFYCMECRSRVTVGSEQVEYGHYGDCPYRPSSLPGAAGSKQGDRHE